MVNVSERFFTDAIMFMLPPCPVNFKNAATDDLWTNPMGLGRRYEGRSKVLQLDYKEEWKCYKLHIIFQYNLY